MRLRRTIAAIAVIGGAIAAYLTYVHYAHTSPICTTGGCEKVQRSSYAKLDGVPVALLGLIGYAALLATAAVRGTWAALAGAVAGLSGAAFSGYLLREAGKPDEHACREIHSHSHGEPTAAPRVRLRQRCHEVATRRQPQGEVALCVRRDRAGRARDWAAGHGALRHREAGVRERPPRIARRRAFAGRPRAAVRDLGLADQPPGRAGRRGGTGRAGGDACADERCDRDEPVHVRCCTRRGRSPNPGRRFPAGPGGCDCPTRPWRSTRPRRARSGRRSWPGSACPSSSRPRRRRWWRRCCCSPRGTPSRTGTTG